MSSRSISLIVLLGAPITLLIFSLLDLSTIENSRFFFFSFSSSISLLFKVFDSLLVVVVQLLIQSDSCNPMDSSLPGSSGHWISQAAILEWLAISFSRGASRPRNKTCTSCIIYNLGKFSLENQCIYLHIITLSLIKSLVLNLALLEVI